MSDFTTRLQLAYLLPSQAQKHVSVNESLQRLDALVQATAVSATLSTQPASPLDASVYILPPGKTGAQWGSMANGALAYYVDGAWQQIIARAGFRVFVADQNEFLTFDGTSWRTLAALMPNQSFRNRLINGAFPLWQRMNAGTGAIYVADRWRGVTTGTGMSKQTDGPTGFAQCIEVSGIAAGIEQRLEGAQVADLVGKTIVVAFWMKNVSGTGAISVRLAAPSSLDTFTTTTQFTSVDVGAPTTSWTRVVARFADLPASIANGLSISLVRAGTASETMRLTGIQCEAGTEATAFEPRPLALETSLARRFFQRLGVGFTGRWFSANHFWVGGVLPSPMRATPTLSLKTTSVSVIEPGIAVRSTTSATLTAIAATTNGLRTAEITGFSGATVGNSVQMAEDYLNFDAEL